MKRVRAALKAGLPKVDLQPDLIFRVILLQTPVGDDMAPEAVALSLNLARIRSFFK